MPSGKKLFSYETIAVAPIRKPDRHKHPFPSSSMCARLVFAGYDILELPHSGTI